MCKLPNTMHELLTARELEKQEVESLKDKLEEIKKVAKLNLSQNHCNNCDGVGLCECLDKNCATFQMNEILKMLEK